VGIAVCFDSSASARYWEVEFGSKTEISGDLDSEVRESSFEVCMDDGPAVRTGENRD